MRKIISMFCMAAVFACLLTGCGSKSRPKITLLVKVPTLSMVALFNENVTDAQSFMELAGEAFAADYDKADVSIKVEVFDYVDATQAIAECYGTENAPDMVLGGYINIAGYIYGGNAVPLDDIITDEMLGDLDASMLEQGRGSNGKTYLMPYMGYQNIMTYNKEMFRACGLDSYISDTPYEIQNWSIAEWEIILDALAEGLPQNQYPMMMYAGNEQGDTHLMAFLSMFGGSMYDEDRNFDFESDQVIKALTWLQEGTSRGWYMPHCENLVITDCQSKFEKGELAVYLCNNSFVDFPGIEQGYVNFPGNVATTFTTGFVVFDNGEEEKISAAKDFIRYIYETDALLECSAGELPASNKIARKYADDIPMMAEFAANSQNAIDVMHNRPNWQGEEGSVRNVFWPQIHKLLLGTITPEECAANLTRNCNAAIDGDFALHE